MKLGHRRLPSAQGAAVAAVVAVVLLGASGTAAASPAFPVSGQPATLQASSMVVSAFSYAGLSTFTAGDGSQVTALEFTLEGATNITALKTFVPCHDVGSGLLLISVVEADGATVTGQTELFATEFVYTDGTGAHDWTVGSPPSGPGVLDDGVTITAVDVTAVGGSMPSLAMTGERAYAAFCGTGAGATQVRPVPASPAEASPTPTPATPAVSPIPSPATAPSPIASPAGPASPSPPAIEFTPAPTASPIF